MPKIYRFRYKKQPDGFPNNTVWVGSHDHKQVTVIQELWKSDGDTAAAFASLL